MTIKYSRILAVADAIEKDGAAFKDPLTRKPLGFDQRSWCGTACCTAGWAVAIFKPALYAAFRTFQKEGLDCYDDDLVNSAAAILGLSWGDDRDIFDGSFGSMKNRQKHAQALRDWVKTKRREARNERANG